MLYASSAHGFRLLLESITHFNPLFSQNPNPGAAPDVELSLRSTAYPSPESNPNEVRCHEELFV